MGRDTGKEQNGTKNTFDLIFKETNKVSSNFLKQKLEKPFAILFNLKI
jgi:hypothetical protein